MPKANSSVDCNLCRRFMSVLEVCVTFENRRATQADYAAFLEVSQGTLSNVSRCIREPNTAMVQKLLESFPEVDPLWLLVGKARFEDFCQGLRDIVDEIGIDDFSQEIAGPKPIVQAIIDGRICPSGEFLFKVQSSVSVSRFGMARFLLGSSGVSDLQSAIRNDLVLPMEETLNDIASELRDLSVRVSVLSAQFKAMKKRVGLG